MPYLIGMVRITLFLSFFLSVHLLVAQTSTVMVEGLVKDVSNQQLLRDVNLAVRGIPFTGTSTDETGKFNLAVDSLPIELIISSIGYETLIIQVNDIYTEISLQPSIINLSEIVVRSKPSIDTVFEEPYNVVDFLLLPDNILLLVYRSVIEKFEIVLLDEQERTISRLPLLHQRPISLFKSCVDSLYINTFYGVHRLHINGNELIFGEEISDLFYEQYIKTCLLSKNDIQYFQRHFYQGQALLFYALTANAQDSTVFLPMIEDEQQIIRLIEDAGFRLPWSGDFWDEKIFGGLRSLRDGPYQLKGAMRMFYPKLYIPIFSVGDDLCVINHLHARLQHFDGFGNLMKEIPIDYQNAKNWKGLILQDETTQGIYTLFHSRWGEYICPVNTETGELGDAIEIDIDFSENLKLKDGILYFLHRNAYAGIGNKMLKKVRVATALP